MTCDECKPFEEEALKERDAAHKEFSELLGTDFMKNTQSDRPFLVGIYKHYVIEEVTPYCINKSCQYSK